ncbi:glycoside hydrolase family 10 protein [Streptomyces sp. MAR4 CNX-425]|uniref:glycoside hydrolase family 10 protein n=1 Tax=Streptomyces sp. MAR4 CNX-425 TaxID=3406343 RepID=UPI003B503401
MPLRRHIPLTFVSAAALAASLLAAAPNAGAAPPAVAPDASSQATAQATAPAADPVTATLDAVDPSAENNPGGLDSNGACFPGCRGAEQLLAYTPAYGETTGTNEYGTEVVVEDGRVVKVGGSDSPIPANGLVLSGHGSRGRWLSEHATLGTKVEISGKQLTLTFDTEAHLVRARLARDDAQARLEAARDSCTVFPESDVRDRLDTADRRIEAAAAALADGREPDALALAAEAREAAAAAGDGTRESRPVEGRGVWVRPTETTPEEIRNTLDRIEYAGFNMVYLETVFQGYTIFPSDAAEQAGIEAQRPNMRGFDPLQVWVDEAHKRDIELHAWTHTFFVGADGAGGPGAVKGPGPVLKAHPEWAAVEREDVGADAPRPSTQEPGYYFVDPAMPEPRAYIRSVFKEVLTDYDVDGLHLDYIRYPVSLPYDSSFSYSDYSRDAFEAKHGVDPYTLTESDPKWEDWNLWRENNITTFVEGIRNLQRNTRPDTALSAAVFADPVDGLKKKFQNWGAWVDAGYLDFLTGMSFGSSPESVGEDTRVMRERVGLAYLYTATYGPFNGSPAALMGDQLQAVKDADSDGTALFAYNQLTDAQATALHHGAYRTPARAPHSDPATATAQALAPLRARIDAAAECVRPGDARPVTARLLAAEKLLKNGTNPDAALRQLRQATAAVDRWEGAQPDFTAAVGRDLRMLTRWLQQAR